MTKMKDLNKDIAYNLLFDMGGDFGEFTYKHFEVVDGKGFLFVVNKEGVIFKHTIKTEEI